MKRKFIAGLMLSTMIFSLTACSSSEDKKETTTIESSDVETKQEVATEQNSSEESKKLLEDAGFILDSYEGLSYYAPPKDSYAYATAEKAEEVNRSYIVKQYEILGTGDIAEITRIRYYFRDDIKFSSVSIETILSEVTYGEYDMSKLIETDAMYIYATSCFESDEYKGCNAYIFVKDTYDMYRISNNPSYIDGYENAYENIKYEKCWTEETWNAFLDTLTYVK